MRCRDICIYDEDFLFMSGFLKIIRIALILSFIIPGVFDPSEVFCQDEDLSDYDELNASSNSDGYGLFNSTLNSSASIAQAGVLNELLSFQSGAVNIISSCQTGNNNHAELYQNGGLNYIFLSQNGSDNFVSVEQNSTGNFLSVIQSGSGNSLTCIQNGGEAASVMQENGGTAVFTTR